MYSNVEKRLPEVGFEPSANSSDGDLVVVIIMYYVL